MGCSTYQIKPNHVAFNVGHGKDTCLGDLSKVEENSEYDISTFSVELIKDYKTWSKSLEISIIDHSYSYGNESEYDLKHSNSFSFKIWLTKIFLFKYVDVFIGAGIGAGYMNPTKNNQYLANNKITSDLGIRFGLQKSFKYFDIRIENMLRHFSAIWKDDSGANLDEVRIGVVIPF